MSYSVLIVICLCLLCPEKAQHPVCYGKAADNVEGRGDDGEGAQYFFNHGGRLRKQNDGSEYRNSGDGVGHRHQGRVQKRWNSGNQQVTDEKRPQKNANH